MYAISSVALGEASSGRLKAAHQLSDG